jgi:hypothetical protein
MDEDTVLVPEVVPLDVTDEVADVVTLLDTVLVALLVADALRLVVAVDETEDDALLVIVLVCVVSMHVRKLPSKYPLIAVFINDTVLLQSLMSAMRRLLLSEQLAVPSLASNLSPCCTWPAILLITAATARQLDPEPPTYLRTSSPRTVAQPTLVEGTPPSQIGKSAFRAPAWLEQTPSLRIYCVPDDK